MIFREKKNCHKIAYVRYMIQKVYPWEVGNLSLINPIKRIRDGIRPLEVMIKAL